MIDERADSDWANLKASHPSRVRGLKCRWNGTRWHLFVVAPFTGAWIEINDDKYKEILFISHPSRVRGLKFEHMIHAQQTAPSHPSRVRGLKYSPLSASCWLPESHPSRVRGLKSLPAICRSRPVFVAPFTGAWIEILQRVGIICSWCGRTLHGCVDWNWISRHIFQRQAHVAPFTGAWIEIL